MLGSTVVGMSLTTIIVDATPSRIGVRTPNIAAAADRIKVESEEWSAQGAQKVGAGSQHPARARSISHS